MSIFEGTAPFLKVGQSVAMETMQLHKIKRNLFLRKISLHLSGPTIKQIYIHKNISIGVIMPWDTSFSNDFHPDILSFH